MPQVKNEETKNVEKTTAKQPARGRKSASTKSATATKAAEKTETKKEVRKFKPDDLIPCKSVVEGSLTYVGVSGMRYEWSGYGDVRELPYQDIVSLRSRKSPFLYAPWLIVEDEDFLEIANHKKDFEKMYELYSSFETTDGFFDCSPEEMKAKLQNAPAGFKQLIIESAGKLIRSGELDSIGMINAIDDVLGTNIKMMLN